MKRYFGSSFNILFSIAIDHQLYASNHLKYSFFTRIGLQGRKGPITEMQALCQTRENYKCNNYNMLLYDMLGYETQVGKFVLFGTKNCGK